MNAVSILVNLKQHLVTATEVINNNWESYDEHANDVFEADFNYKSILVTCNYFDNIASEKAYLFLTTVFKYFLALHNLR